MTKILLSIVLAIGLASTASAQCSAGNCRNVSQPRLNVSQPRLKAGPGPARAAKRAVAAPVRAAKGLLGQTRFFDGDGRPLRKAR